jgi:hypothetical protein
VTVIALPPRHASQATALRLKRAERKKFQEGTGGRNPVVLRSSRLTCL